MTSRLYIAKVGGGEIELTDFTGLKGSPMLDRSEPLVEMGMRFANGESSQGTFKLMDPAGELPRADFEYNLPPHKLVTWTEDASGTEIWLTRGRVATLDGGRGVSVGANNVDFDVVIDDGNVELRGQAFAENWSRPAETGFARLVALQAYTLNGGSSTSPTARATCEVTVSSSHLAPNSNSVTMPAKVYPPGTEPQDVVTECADTEGKVYGVGIHHTGGSHLCLQYIVETDHSTYTTAVKISDQISEWDPTHATAPVLEPHWQMGKATVQDGQELASGIVSVRGENQAVFVEYPDNITDYDRWTVAFSDSESESAAQQTAIANSLLLYRRNVHVTHRVSVIIEPDQTHLLGSGMSIQIKAVAALGGQYLGTWQTRRIAECTFRPRADGRYWADMHIDRAIRRRPYRMGSKSTFGLPCADFAPIASLGATADDDPVNYLAGVVTGPRVEWVEHVLPQSVAVGQSIVVLAGHTADSEPAVAVWDDAGNTYTQAAAHLNGGGGAMPHVFIYYTNVTSPLSAGQSIYFETDVGSSVNNVTLETNDKALSAYLFDGLLSAGTESGTGSGFSGSPSVAVGGTSGLLVAAFVAKTGATGVPDVVGNDADWTAFTQAFSPAEDSAIHIAGGFRINDAGGETWSGTIDQSRDWATVGSIFTVSACVPDTPAVGSESDDGTSPTPAHRDHTHEARTIVRKNSAGSEFTRRRVNLIEGANITLTVADDSGNNEVDVTIAAAGGAAGSTVYARKTSDQNVTSATFVDITGLTVSVLANAVYRVKAGIFLITSAAGEGYNLSVNGPSGTYKLGGIIPAAAPNSGGSAANHAQGAVADTAGLSATAGPGAAPVLAIVEGVVVIGASGGTLAMRVRAETGGAQSVTVQTNSFMEVTQL